MQRYILTLILFCACNAALHASNPNSPATLQAAFKLGQKLEADGWTYGSRADRKEVDCVRFVLQVLESHFQMTFGSEFRKAVLIADLSAADAVRNKGGIITRGDVRTRGVQRALIESGMGHAVSLSDAQPGDFIQYWMKKKDGTWFGHAGIVHRISESHGVRRAFLYGAHKSVNGIGTRPRAGLRLVRADDRRIYIARVP